MYNSQMVKMALCTEETEEGRRMWDWLAVCARDERRKRKGRSVSRTASASHKQELQHRTEARSLSVESAVDASQGQGQGHHPQISPFRQFPLPFSSG